MDKEQARDLQKGLRARARDCREIAESYLKRAEISGDASSVTDASRCIGKAFAYDHAADLLDVWHLT